MQFGLLDIGIKLGTEYISWASGDGRAFIVGDYACGGDSLPPVSEKLHTGYSISFGSCE